jgi:hypothetical protein
MLDVQPYAYVQPPSIARLAPVICAASSPHRNGRLMKETIPYSLYSYALACEQATHKIVLQRRISTFAASGAEICAGAELLRT